MLRKLKVLYNIGDYYYPGELCYTESSCLFWVWRMQETELQAQVSNLRILFTFAFFLKVNSTKPSLVSSNPRHAGWMDHLCSCLSP